MTDDVNPGIEKKTATPLREDQSIAQSEKAELVNAPGATMRAIENKRSNLSNGSLDSTQERSIEIELDNGFMESRNSREQLVSNSKNSNEIVIDVSTKPDKLRGRAESIDNTALVKDVLGYGLLAAKPPEQRNRAEILSNGENHSEVSEKLQPKEGIPIKFKDLLEHYKTPFTDAYYKSKTLPPGQPGKLPELEKLIDRMLKCPWLEDLNVVFSKTGDHPEYNSKESRITIVTGDPPEKQIQIFAHEAFHSTHQSLKDLYLGVLPVSPESYANLKLKQEIGAFEAEIAVSKELSKQLKAPLTVFFRWANLKHEKQPDMDLVQLYETKGEPALLKFLADDALTVMTIHGEKRAYTYRQYYLKSYGEYLFGFKSSHDVVSKMVSSSPSTKTAIENEGY